MQINPLPWVRFMDTFSGTHQDLLNNLKQLNLLTEFFWVHSTMTPVSVTTLSVFDRNLGYYSQDELEDNGKLLPWNQSTSGLQQSRFISCISSCRIFLISNCRIIIVVELWRLAVYTALVLAIDCNISLLPARPYFSAEYLRWRAMTGSGNNVTIPCKYCCR